MKTQLGYGKAAILGLVAGLAMAMLAMMVTALSGMGLFAMPAMIGGLVFGPAAVMSAGVGVILAGLMLHMAFSMMFGVAYAAIVNLWTKETLFTGIVFGLALWAFNLHILARIVPGAAFIAEHEPGWLAIMTHLVFGATLGLLARSAAPSALGTNAR